MRHGSHHCDHTFARDDATSEVCVNCGKRREIDYE